jgi:hypothetical protein
MLIKISLFNISLTLTTGEIEMKRRLAFLLFSAVLMLSNIGCSSKNISENKNITPNVTQPPVATPSVTYSPILNPTEQPTNVPENITQKENLRFIVLADSRGSDHGVNSEIVKKILKEVKQLSPQPEFAIMPGDLTDGSKSYLEIKSQLDYFKQIITQFYPVLFFYPGIGNHEMRAGENGEKAFSETFSEFSANFLEGYNKTTYYFDAGDVRLFMLNSDHPGEMHKITGEQLDWLNLNIDQDKKYNIFLLHEPPYPTGAEAGNSLDRYPESRDAFWKLIDDTKNPIVFCGHEHNYSRRLVDSSFNEKVGSKNFEFSKGVYQIITGGFGAPRYTEYSLTKNMVIPPVPQYHFTVVDINDNGVSTQAINIDGEIIDSFQVK